MPIYPDLTFPLNFSQKDQIMYEQIINRICFEYFKQLGEFKGQFYFEASNTGIVIPGGMGSIGNTNGNKIICYLPTQPDSLELTAYSSLIAHELAHLWIGNIYGPQTKEMNNLVHYAANHGSYLTKKTIWFIQWSTPYLPIMVFDIAGLVRDSAAIMLKCTLEQGHPNIYWN